MGNKNFPRIIGDNYGQYDKGTAECDKGAYGDINGLCNYPPILKPIQTQAWL